MAQPIAPDYGQQFLFPPALEDWVSADHPARFLREFVDQLDLSTLGFAMPVAVEGRPPYHPSLLLKIWLYGYYHRIRSTRKLETACREALNWAIPIAVSVNVAPAQLRRPEIVAEVRDLLAATGLPPSRLKLEVTENQLLEETADMFATMGALRDLGVQLVLDDFGTGYSSLSTLRSYPFSDVKIDRSFMQGIVHDDRSRGLIEAILQVCQVLELNCVAEGVETEEQLTLLSSLGCTHVQGYLIQRPEASAKIRRTLWRVAADERQGAPKPVADMVLEIAGAPGHR